MWNSYYFTLILFVILIFVIILVAASASNARGSIRKRRRDEVGQWQDVAPTCTGSPDCDPILYSTGQSIDEVNVTNNNLLYQGVRVATPPSLDPAVASSADEDYNVTIGPYDALAIWGSPRQSSVKIGYTPTDNKNSSLNVYTSIYNSSISGDIAKPICWILTSNKNIIGNLKAKLAEDGDFPDSVMYRIIPLVGETNSMVLDITDDSTTIWNSAFYNNDESPWAQIAYKKSSLTEYDITAV